jgi:hypothetical protein
MDAGQQLQVWHCVLLLQLQPSLQEAQPAGSVTMIGEMADTFFKSICMQCVLNTRSCIQCATGIVCVCS